MQRNKIEKKIEQNNTKQDKEAYQIPRLLPKIQSPRLDKTDHRNGFLTHGAEVLVMSAFGDIGGYGIKVSGIGLGLWSLECPNFPKIQDSIQGV